MEPAKDPQFTPPRDQSEPQPEQGSLLARLAKSLGAGEPGYRDRIVEALAKDLGGNFTDSQKHPGRHYVAEFKAGELTFEVYSWTVVSRQPAVGYTLELIAHANQDYRLAVSKSNLVDDVKALFGVKDLQLGVAEFDDALRIHSNNDELTRQLLLSSSLVDDLCHLDSTFYLTLDHIQSNEAETQDKIHIRLDRNGDMSLESLKMFHQVFSRVLEELQKFKILA